MAAVAGENLFLSADAGRTWQGTSADPRLHDLAFDPAHPGVLYAASALGLARSLDDGATWKRLPSPFSTFGLLTLEVLDRSTLLAAGDGIARSTDRGRTWTQALSASAGPFLRALDRITVDPFEPARIYVSGYLIRIVPRVVRVEIAGSELWRSSDGGRTWNLVPGLATVAFDPAQAGTLYASATDGTIQQSLDGGVSWAVVGTPGTEVAGALLVDPAAPESLFAASRSGEALERSSDGGRSWSPARGGLQGLPLGAGVELWADPAVAQRIYLAAGGGFFAARFP